MLCSPLALSPDMVSDHGVLEYSCGINAIDIVLPRDRSMCAVRNGGRPYLVLYHSLCVYPAGDVGCSFGVGVAT